MFPDCATKLWKKTQWCENRDGHLYFRERVCNVEYIPGGVATGSGEIRLRRVVTVNI